MKKLLLTSCGALLALGCAGTPKPTSQLASTEGAIRAASEMGANNEPQASLYLRFAKEGRDAAVKLMAEDDSDANKRAKSRLEMAEADAELALAMAKTKASAADAKQVVSETQQLQQQLNNGSTP